MVHLKNRTHSPKNAAQLLQRARSLIQSEGVVVRDARVSRKYIEFDISVPKDIDAKETISRLESISPVSSIEAVTERHLSKQDAIEQAIIAFNDEKYWNAHELLEGVWKSTSGAEKNILNGIILVAAAFVHDEKNESEICLSILRRALKKLEGERGTYFGIDLDKIAARTVEIVSSGVITRFSI